jgi:Protein of unknown function (DUF1194)
MGLPHRRLNSEIAHMRALFWIALFLAVPLGTPLARAAQPVDLELVLAMDVSSSMTEREAWLQRYGYIAAFTDQRVVEAIRSGPLGAIAVTYIEWSGADRQRMTIDWTVIYDTASAVAFANRIALATPARGSYTSISGIIDHAASLFAVNDYDGSRHVIDVSGNGVNNHGRSAAKARDAAVAQHITINGLPITRDDAGLKAHYAEEVIGGPGAFLVVADSFGAFGDAILKKLVVEIAGLSPE